MKILAVAHPTQFELSLVETVESENERIYLGLGMKWHVCRQKIGCCKNDELFLKLELLDVSSCTIKKPQGLINDSIQEANDDFILKESTPAAGAQPLLSIV